MDSHDWITDRALIEAAQRGDRDAAARLYHRHIDRVHRICHRIVLDTIQGKASRPILIGYNRESYDTRVMGAMVILLEPDATGPTTEAT